MTSTDLLEDISRGVGTKRWQAAHTAAALRRAQAEQESAKTHVLPCGHCGRRLFRVVVDHKPVWAHEALEDEQTCQLITFK